VQTLVLIPYLRARRLAAPAFDFRGTGLGHTLRLGLWTVGFVILNQVAFFVVSRIATGSSVTAATEGTEAAGVTVYQNAFLVTQVPHAIITVSLVTATMPMLSRLAADGDRAGMRREITSTLRVVLTAIVPFAVVLACLGDPIAGFLFGYGESGGIDVIGSTISAFAPGLVLFTVHYLLLRGFYADEDTRTPSSSRSGWPPPTSRPRSPTRLKRRQTASRRCWRWRTRPRTSSER
jgi:putative peptidoglycan lipid II flippase